MEKIIFNTGVTVDFENEQLKVSTATYKGTIDFKHLDNISYTQVSIPRITPIGLAFRTLIYGLIASFIIVLPVHDEWGALFFTANAIDVFLLWLSIIVVIGSVLISGSIIFGLVFSVFMETSFLTRFINKNFADHRFVVVVGNKSGNNIKFYALIEEIEKVKQIEKYLVKLKQTIQSENTNTTDYPNSSYLIELEKLNDLFKQGILTDSEFSTKKTEILNRKN